jgi:signal transduction histidine kinase
LQLELLEQEIPPDASAGLKRLAEARDLVEHTIIEIRRLIAALSPAILDQMGLAAALRQLVGRFRALHPAEVHLHLARQITLPKKIEIIVYRLVQEIFNNIAKYSLASHVNLWMDSADGYLRLHIEDDGVGFDVEAAFSRRDCFGLSGLRERVALLGGSLLVKSLSRSATGPAVLEGKRPHAKRRKDRKEEIATGQIGIERPGTAIWIELPVPPLENSEKRPDDKDIADGKLASVTRKRLRRNLSRS